MKNEKKTEYFELCGEKFSVECFPKLYERFLTGKFGVEQWLKSLADKIYEGNVVTAAQMLESDLEHDG